MVKGNIFDGQANRVVVIIILGNEMHGCGSKRVKIIIIPVYNFLRNRKGAILVTDTRTDKGRVSALLAFIVALKPSSMGLEMVFVHGSDVAEIYVVVRVVAIDVYRVCFIVRMPDIKLLFGEGNKRVQHINFQHHKEVVIHRLVRDVP